MGNTVPLKVMRHGDRASGARVTVRIEMSEMGMTSQAYTLGEQVPGTYSARISARGMR
jgi:hypothetical protein